MNQSVTRLTLDVSVMEKQACISVRQKDTMRRLVFSLVDRGLPYKLEDGVYAAVSVNTLPDTMLYPTVIQDGKVHFDVPADLVQEVNDYTCELILFATDSRVLSTSSFDLIVYHSNAADYNADEAVDSDKFLLMTSATAEALDAAADARNAADLANDAREDAEEAAGRAVEISETLENKLAAGEFKGEKGDTGATGPQGPKGDPGEDGKDYDYGNIRETLEITLKSTDWADNKQTIEANAISENCTLVASPTTESTEAYIASGIMLTEAEVGEMAFECVVPPTEDIAVLVHVIDPLIAVESTEILSFDSVDEMNAYEAEDGTIAIVPSEDSVIALSKYKYEDGQSINDKIVYLFGTGGETASGNDNGSFWADLKKLANPVFSFDASVMTAGLTLECPALTVQKINGEPRNVAVSFDIVMSGTTTKLSIEFSKAVDATSGIYIGTQINLKTEAV